MCYAPVEQKSFSIRACATNAIQHWSSRTVDSRAAATPRAVNRPTLAAGMYAVLAAFRGRSTNVQVYDVDLPTNSRGTTCVARGLRSGCDGFEPGAFIGFYTGRWGTR